MASKNIKELTPAQSLKKVKELLAERKKMGKSDLIPGNLIFTSYNAKNKEQTYDKTPLILILKRNNNHTLGLNFHWIPLSMRINLIKQIIKMNGRNIANNKPLEFSYEQLKPMLKGLGYAPCIRLYINKRLSQTGVVIPPERLLEIARLRAETFTNGRFSATQLLQIARQAGKRKSK